MIEVFYGDESGFWQNPVVARAWQFAGEDIRLLPEKGKRLSVFGLLNRDCEGKFWSVEKTIKSEFVIECLEEWNKDKSDLPGVLVLDNARIHRSQKMRKKLPEWEEKGFYIFNLPTCSPHLNIIEILRRKIKYEWLKPKDYASLGNLTQKVIKNRRNLLKSVYKQGLAPIFTPDFHLVSNLVFEECLVQPSRAVFLLKNRIRRES